MKTTLTKADPVGFYLADDERNGTTGVYWDGKDQFLWRKDGDGYSRAPVGRFTNFRPLVEAPTEYITVKKRAEQFFTAFAARPVCDMQDVFERHLREHVARLAVELDDAREKVRSQSATALFHRTLMEETMTVARGYGWQPGSSLANWLKSRLSLADGGLSFAQYCELQRIHKSGKATDQHIGTQDTSDIQGLGDGDDTWEAPDLDDRHEPTPETLVSKVEILDAKFVPDSPGEWHHRNGDILRVWESKHPDQSGNVHLRGQFVFPDRCTTLVGAHISKFASHHCDWVKAVPPFDPCEAVKSLRQLARDVHEACDKAGIPTHSPKMARAALPEPLSIRDRLSRIVTQCHDKDGMIVRLNDGINQLRTQLDTNMDECVKREGKLSAIGRVVQPLAGETLVNAVVRKMGELNRLLEVIKSEGDPVGTVKALRTQRDHLRREVSVQLQHVRTVANELQGVIDRNIKAAA